MLQILVALLLAVHLWCVNLSAASPLFGLWYRWLSRRHASNALWREARWLGIQGIAMLLAGTVAGLLLAGVMWIVGDRGLFEVLPSFSYKIRWAIWELVFYVACMLGYLGLSADRWSNNRWAYSFQVLLAVLASTNLLYHFPPLFSVMAQAAARPELISASVGPQEFRELMLRGHVPALTAHFALASLAVAGVVGMHRLLWLTAADQDSPAIVSAARTSAAIALTATAVQLLVGLLVLLSLGTLSQSRLMGGDWLGTSCLALSVLATFALLHRLATASFSPANHSQARQTLFLLMLILLLMTLTLRRAEAPVRTSMNAKHADAQRRFEDLSVFSSVHPPRSCDFSA